MITMFVYHQKPNVTAKQQLYGEGDDAWGSNRGFEKEMFGVLAFYHEGARYTGPRHHEDQF